MIRIIHDDSFDLQRYSTPLWRFVALVFGVLFGIVVTSAVTNWPPYTAKFGRAYFMLVKFGATFWIFLYAASQIAKWQQRK